MNKRIIIAGPTASGKSSLAIQLALQTHSEIVSIDSRQCYRLIDIGTAKPTAEQLLHVPHHNISVLDLDEPDSVAQFRVRVLNYADTVENRGKKVVFCGGSTLHLQSLIQPLDDIPPANPKHIVQLQEQANRDGLKNLFRQLQDVDPEYAKSMDGMNRQRIFRALDVWMQTGKPFSSFHSNKKPELPVNYFFFGLNHPRDVLHQRIEKRTDQMIKLGLIDETRSLLNLGFSPSLQAFQTVGYKQAVQHIKGEISYEQMVKDIKTATRRYAKRQITWLRRWNFVRWIDMSINSEQNAIDYIQQQVAAKP